VRIPEDFDPEKYPHVSALLLTAAGWHQGVINSYLWYTNDRRISEVIEREFDGRYGRMLTEAWRLEFVDDSWRK
jgi:hypothetical protein